MNLNLNHFKLSCEISGHTNDVRYVVVGPTVPEGQMIISASRDETVRVWKPNSAGYSQVKIFNRQDNTICALSYQEKENWICIGSHDGSIEVFHATSYEQITTLKGHKGAVCAVAAGLEANSIISGSYDKTARIWSLDIEGTTIRYIDIVGHREAVCTVASHVQQRVYITGSLDKRIIFWNQIGKRMYVLHAHSQAVRAVLLLSTSHIATCAKEDKIRYWSLKGELRQELNINGKHVFTIAHNQALGENIIVAAVEDGALQLWNVHEGNQLGNNLMVSTHALWSLACLQNGDIVTGGSDGIIRVFTTNSQRFAIESVMRKFEQLVKEKRMFLGMEIENSDKIPGFRDGFRRELEVVVQRWKSTVEAEEVNKYSCCTFHLTTATQEENLPKAILEKTQHSTSTSTISSTASATISTAEAVEVSKESEIAAILIQLKRNCFTQLIGMRALADMLIKEDGRKLISKHLPDLMNIISPMPNANCQMQIAIATFILKAAMMQVHITDNEDNYKVLANSAVQTFLCTDDLQACYFLIKAFYSLCKSSNDAKTTISTCPEVMLKLEVLTNATYSEEFHKINHAGKALLKRLQQQEEL